MERALFGGAMRAIVPDTFTDVSTIRQVPDNQEVFADTVTEASLIVEIIAHDEAVTDAGAAEYFFHDMAEGNRATDAVVLSQSIARNFEFAPLISNGVKCRLLGLQNVFKSRTSTEVDKVFVMLVALRFPSVASDILIWMQCPQRTEELLQSEIGWTEEEISNAGPCGAAARVLLQFINSFRIDDWAIFG